MKFPSAQQLQCEHISMAMACGHRTESETPCVSDACFHNGWTVLTAGSPKLAPKLLLFLLFISVPTLPPTCRLPHPAWPRPVRVSPIHGKGQEKMVPQRCSRETVEVHLDAVRRHLKIPRSILPPCGVRGQCEESSRVQRRRKRSRREGGRREMGWESVGGDGQAEAVSGLWLCWKGSPSEGRSEERVLAGPWEHKGLHFGDWS